MATAGAFAPTGIAGCIGWFDASDAGSFSYHSGTLVSQWDDLSGDGNHLVQASSSSAPNRSGTQNSLTTVLFSGAEFLQDSGGGLVSHLSSADNDFSFAAVYDTGSTPAAFLFGSTPGVSNRGVGLFRSSATVAEFRSRNAAAQRVRTVAVPSDGWRTIIGTSDASSTTARIPTLRSNGSDGAAESTSAAASAASSFGVGLRALASGNFFDGALAELIFYDNIISGSDLTDLENYLRAKWATW